MSIFGKDHYIKFCITTSCQKMLEVNIWISSSQQDNTENHHFVMCQLYAVFMSTFIFIMSHFWGKIS